MLFFCLSFSVESLKGKLLIADPSLIGDDSFSRSIILMAEHNDEGALGFVLNKPTPYSLDQILDGVPNSNMIYKGGPVDTDNLFYIHNCPELIANSVQINEELYWGGDFEKLSELLNDKVLDPDDVRFFVGYSGWSANQLEFEMEQNSWIALDDDISAQILSKSAESLWKEKLKNLGGTYLLWVNTPEDPNLN